MLSITFSAMANKMLGYKGHVNSISNIFYSVVIILMKKKTIHIYMQYICFIYELCEALEEFSFPVLRKISRNLNYFRIALAVICGIFTTSYVFHTLYILSVNLIKNLWDNNYLFLLWRWWADYSCHTSVKYEAKIKNSSVQF